MIPFLRLIAISVVQCVSFVVVIVRFDLSWVGGVIGIVNDFEVFPFKVCNMYIVMRFALFYFEEGSKCQLLFGRGQWLNYMWFSKFDKSLFILHG